MIIVNMIKNYTVKMHPIIISAIFILPIFTGAVAAYFIYDAGTFFPVHDFSGGPVQGPERCLSGVSGLYHSLPLPQVPAAFQYLMWGTMASMALIWGLIIRK